MKNFVKSNLKSKSAQISFLSNDSSILDIYVSFARQASQAFNINTSKTIYPIKNTSDLQLHPLKSTIQQDSLPKELHPSLPYLDSSKISYKTSRWTINKSPFIDGRHQDQFEIREYRRSLVLFDAKLEIVKRWLHYVTLNLPAGVGIEYSLHDYKQI